MAMPALEGDDQPVTRREFRTQVDWMLTQIVEGLADQDARLEARFDRVEAQQAEMLTILRELQRFVGKPSDYSPA